MPAQTRARGRGSRGGRGGRVPYARKSLTESTNQSITPQAELQALVAQTSYLQTMPNLANNGENSSIADTLASTKAFCYTGSEFTNIKILSNLIPLFNGDKSKLYKFMSQCRRAEKFCSPRDTRTLIEIIISKLEGEAARVLQRLVKIDTVTDIINAVKSHFIPAMDIGLAQAEMIKLTQEDGEKVRMYGLRMAEKLDHGVESAKEFYNEQEFVGVKVSLERTAIRSFINGLSNTMEKCLISFVEPDSLNKAN